MGISTYLFFPIEGDTLKRGLKVMQQLQGERGSKKVVYDTEGVKR